MAQSDITIDALSKVGQQDAEYLVSLVRSVPGFPKEGIIFRDFMPVLADPKGLKILLKALEEALPVSPSEFDSIAGLESRGFCSAGHGRPFGQGFIAVRKAGKLPPETIGESYDLEYGTASVEIETDAVQAGKRVLIVDDSSPRRHRQSRHRPYRKGRWHRGGLQFRDAARWPRRSG